MAVTNAKPKPHHRSQRFAASGTFTVPAGVFFATSRGHGGTGGTAHLYGGDETVNSGSASTVAFTGGTVTHPPLPGMTARNVMHFIDGINGAAIAPRITTSGPNVQSRRLSDVPESTGGGAVTPGASIAVTIGAGGAAAASKLAGASGYVIIEWMV